MGKSKEQLLIEAIDAFHWITNNNLQLSHGPWDLKGHEYQVAWLQETAPEQCFIKGAQIGAELDITLPIRTPYGWKLMGEIEVDDQIFDETGNVCTVTAVFPIKRDLNCYKLIFSDGSEIIASETHKWKVRNVKYDSYHILPTIELYKKVHYRNGARARYSIDVASALKIEEKELELHPYILGLWLGDGARHTGYITAENFDAEQYKKTILSLGYKTQFYSYKRDPHILSCKITKDKKTLISILKNLLTKDDNGICIKRIPLEYLNGSYEQRLDLLCGLIDTDGYIDKNGSCFFYNSDYNLIKDVLLLVVSLGLKAKINYLGLNNGILPNKSYRKTPPTNKWEVYFKADKSIRISKLERKYIRQQKIKRTKETNSRYITNIFPVPPIPVRCISVDSPSRLYLAGETLIPTHNTEALVLRTLHGMIHGHYNAGSLYLFPTRDDVKDFSKARFDPLIESNQFIRQFVQNTDAQNIKQIGRGFLYLRGARSTKTVGGAKKSSSQLKSIPVDRVVFDERDEMEDSMVELARERVSHSHVKEIITLGTPTIPDYGIDAQYKLSDQRVWFIRCEACGKETCLELEFPNGLSRRLDGSVFRSCIHCGKEIYPHNGKWVPQYKDRSYVGWWISQLNSIYIEPKKILELYEDPPNGDLSEVMNSKLGRAYIPAENRLTIQDVYACCSQDPMMMKHDGPACMGVDVGKHLNVVIAVKKSRYTVKVIWCGRVGDFTDLHDLSKKFNVKSTVIDLKPETRKVRDFQKAEPYSIFGCDYVETRTGMTSWDEKERIIKCNRTEICDATHNLVTEIGRLELPRRNAEIDTFAKEMCNMAKVLEEDEESGSKVYRYKKLGADHYRHAMNYCLLASDRVGAVSDSSIINRFFRRRQGRTFMTS